MNGVIPCTRSVHTWLDGAASTATALVLDCCPAAHLRWRFLRPRLASALPGAPRDAAASDAALLEAACRVPCRVWRRPDLLRTGLWADAASASFFDAVAVSAEEVELDDALSCARVLDLRKAADVKTQVDVSDADLDPVVAEHGQGWDAVLLVSYPSRRAFSDMVRDPGYQEGTHLRTEALVEAVLQPTVPRG